MALLFSLLCVAIPTDTRAQSRKELESRRKQLVNEIKLTNSLLDETRKNKEVTLSRYTALQRQVKAREELLNTLQAEIEYVDDKLLRTTQVIAELEHDLLLIENEYGAMLRHAYREKATHTDVAFLISADDFAEAFRRWQYLRQYDRYRKHQLTRIVQTKIMLEQEKEGLMARRKEKERLLEAQQWQRSLWVSEMDEKDQLLSDLSQHEKELKLELKQHERARAKLSDAIDRIIQEEMRRLEEEKNTERSSHTTTESGVALSAFQQQRGKLRWPVRNAVITGHFGQQPHPTLVNVTIDNHGIDILSEKGAEVLCVYDGQVLATQFIPGYNHMVIVQHDYDYYSVYSNLSDIFVKKGDVVKAGEPIAKLRVDQATQQSELHFELWHDRQRLNPTPWMVKNP